ncbi:MAG: NUDIX hydrolase [Myxococcales bacterium]|jgi:8-oxo-dGTP diphosphatase|nr:NUDIX hydrolase [Myxococcales bacterium]
MSQQSAQETTQDAAAVNGPPRRPQVAVGAVLTDIIGRVLLIQRGQQPNYGKWTLPGGRVEWGETLEQALARELQAETGLCARMGPLAEILEYIDERFHYIILDYHMSEPEGTLQAGEDALAARFVTLEEAATLSTTPELMAMLHRVLPTAASRPTR